MIVLAALLGKQWVGSDWGWLVDLTKFRIVEMLSLYFHYQQYRCEAEKEFRESRKSGDSDRKTVHM